VQPVAVRILHPPPSRDAGPLERSLATARRANADRLAGAFQAARAQDVRIETDAPAGSFGERVRALVQDLPQGSGLVVLGSGAIPLATSRHAAAFVAVAGSGERRALANSFYSADVIAVGNAAALGDVPDLSGDNALPRWLAEEAGFEVRDLRRRWRLGVDLDSPLDVLVTGRQPEGVDAKVALDRLDRIRLVAADSSAELVIAGRTSAATLRWLERSTASRTRALVEERGLRAIGLAAARGRAPRRAQRPPRSVLGLVLDDRGPEVLGPILAELGDAAVVDSRVLLAHRLGADETSWPAAEDRFASDLLLADRIGDPWLRALTASARDSAIPVLLGGHTLVGPGIRLVMRRGR
jgi:hypothetical protein